MKVLIISNYIRDQQLSMLRFSAQLSDGLRGCGVSSRVISPPVIFGRLPKLFGKIGAYIDKCVIFPVIAAVLARRFDIVHIADHSNAFYLILFNCRKTIITCHDLFAIQIMMNEIQGQSCSLFGGLLQRWNKRALTGAKYLTAVTLQTAKEVRRITGRSTEIAVIPNAISDEFRSNHLDLLSERSGRFFLHVGGNHFYKNRPGVVATFEVIGRHPDFAEHRLKLFGKEPDRSLQVTLEASPLRARIDVIVGASDDEVRDAYRNADALLFLSKMEGFGWPILEAQASGCVVLTSDREPMRSVAGGAAILADPENPMDAARVFLKTIGKSSALRQAGFENVARYRPGSIYPRYVAIYKAILASNSR